jgi:hypothetical protein
MLPWLMTFHAARLGLEAQNAMAFRFFRLVGDSFGLMADSKKIDSVDRIASSSAPRLLGPLGEWNEIVGGEVSWR